MPVEVKGVIELRKALRKYSPDLAKGLTKEMGAALKPIVRKSRSYLPSNEQVISGWVGTQGREQGKFPQYDLSIAKKGIGFKTSPSQPNRKGFRSLARIFNKTAAGAIYEIAGRKSPDSVFVRNINNKFNAPMRGFDKERGKVIYRAWNEDQGRARSAVLKAIDLAGNLFNKRGIKHG